jgi:hypothetical protein
MFWTLRIETGMKSKKRVWGGTVTMFLQRKETPTNESEENEK